MLKFYEHVKPKKLLDSVTLIVMLLVVVLLVAIGTIFSQLTYDMVEEQTRKRAIQTARHIARLPGIEDLIQTDRPLNSIPLLNESIGEETEAHYIMIADKNAKIRFHPDTDLIGTDLTSPLTVRTMTFGRPYSEQTHEYGQRFIRGSVPVIDHDFNVIGMVSAGYSIADIQRVSQSYLEKTIFSVFVFITLGLVAANFIARGVKWLIFGMEPAEIAYLFKERTALIESLREGVLSTDGSGAITIANEAAMKTLAVDTRDEIVGQPISTVVPKLDATGIIETGEALLDREMILKGVPIIVNAAPVEEQHGLVVTFRRKEDIDMIARELAQVKTYSDMLRAQTHEYSNSLHTIVGLIQTGAYDDVLDFIAEETEGHRKLIRLLADRLPDRILSSLIIGKYMYALELKVDFTIDPESSMVDIPDVVDRHTLSTALGNVLDNGFEAALAGSGPPQVTLFMSDYGNDLIFEIEDNGPGIEDDLKDLVFTRGLSTKGNAARGYGLHLARRSMDTLGGTIWFTDRPAGGTRFELTIPKHGAEHGSDRRTDR